MVEKLLIYGNYTKFMENIRTVDSYQTVHRALCSTFLLSSFAAIGFLFSSEGAKLPISNSLATIFISLATFIIINILCFLDVISQETALTSNYLEAIKLERKYSWLPQVHRRMMRSGAHYGSPHRKVTFYVGCGGCSIVMMAFSLLFYLKLGSIIPIIILFVLTIVILTVYGYILIKVAGSYEKLMKILKKI